MNVNEIKLNSEQIDELLKQCNHCATLADGQIASAVYNESVQRNNTGDNRWKHFCAVSTILRIGYIMGQRAERERFKERALNK